MKTSHNKTIKLWEWWFKEQMLGSLQVDSLLSNVKSHTCSENSATRMKSRWNWAEEVQGLDGGKRGTDNSSGIASWSSSPPPKPSVPVKASRSGDPIISTQWGGVNPWSCIRFDLLCAGLIQHDAPVPPVGLRSVWVSCLDLQLPGELKTCCAVVYSHEVTDMDAVPK